MFLLIPFLFSPCLRTWESEGEGFTVRLRVRFRNPSFNFQPSTVKLPHFRHRYSISIINSDQLSKLSQLEIYNLALKFYNDAYTMDQFGCSSPNTVFWLGKNIIFVPI